MEFLFDLIAALKGRSSTPTAHGNPTFLAIRYIATFDSQELGGTASMFSVIKSKHSFRLRRQPLCI
jgi:hypothetical protein